MKATRQIGTKPELALRRALFARGLRYRVGVKLPLTGVRRKADVAFTGKKIAVFVDGCFWHACPQHATWPASSADWWRDKLTTNAKRDRDTDRRLLEADWLPVRIWEHEDIEEAAARIEAIVRNRWPGAPNSQTRPKHPG
jgi:DNA mismatch endonuclease (patch repair protein)